MPESTKPSYPIRIAAARTGLSTHVLRAWEKRYAVVAPSRSDGPRMYSERDITRLRLLRSLVDSGAQIGQIASLATSELTRLLAADAYGPTEATRNSEPPRLHQEIDAVMSALAEMDATNIDATLRRTAVVHTLRDFTQGLLVPVMHEVGTRWEKSDMCPAHEHLLSNSVARLLEWLTETMQVSPLAPRALAVTAAGHRHAFGARIAGLVAMEEGWNVTFLGADLPARDVAVAARLRDVSVILVGATFGDETALPLVDEIRTLNQHIDDDVQILLGGTEAERQSALLEESGAHVLRSYDDLRLSLRALASLHAPLAQQVADSS